MGEEEGRAYRRASPRLVFHPRRHEASVRVRVRPCSREERQKENASEERSSHGFPSRFHMRLSGGKIGWFSRNLATKSRLQTETLNRSTQKRKLVQAVDGGGCEGARICAAPASEMATQSVTGHPSSVIWTVNRIRAKNPTPAGYP